MGRLWDIVESALVGGIDDALKAFVKEVATGSYTIEEVRAVAKELNEANNELEG